MEDITRGGQFLVKETKCENVFTPEDFSDEQIMMRDSVKEFVDKEIWPNKNPISPAFFITSSVKA